jgi:predicted PurR-regulated permease PerM
MASDQDFARRMLQTVLTVSAVTILVAIFWAAREALMLVYISALIAMGFSPLVHMIERPRAGGRRSAVPRWLAILVIYLTVVGIVVIIGLMVVPPLVAQSVALWDRLPDEFNRFQGFLIRYRILRGPITLAEAVRSAPQGSGANAVGTVLGAVSGVIGGVFGFITIIILSFYLLIEARAMFEYWIRFVPTARRGDVAIAAREAVLKVSAWLRAQFVLAGVMGTFTAVGLGLMGVPYFYVVALVAAIGETIPIVGPVIGGITAVAVAITVSAKLAAMVGAYFLILHQLEANILVPKIMERRVGVSPVAVMVALLIGGSLWGLIGAILAIPTVAILSIIVDQIAAARDTMRLEA